MTSIQSDIGACVPSIGISTTPYEVPGLGTHHLRTCQGAILLRRGDKTVASTTDPGDRQLAEKDPRLLICKLLGVDHDDIERMIIGGLQNVAKIPRTPSYCE